MNVQQCVFLSVSLHVYIFINMSALMSICFIFFLIQEFTLILVNKCRPILRSVHLSVCNVFLFVLLLQLMLFIQLSVTAAAAVDIHQGQTFQASGMVSKGPLFSPYHQPIPTTSTLTDCTPLIYVNGVNRKSHGKIPQIYSYLIMNRNFRFPN